MNSLVRAVVRLCTATGVPRRAMLRARLAPITASPATPILLVPVDPSVAAVIVLPRKGSARATVPTTRAHGAGSPPVRGERGEIIRWLHLGGRRHHVLGVPLDHARLGHPGHPTVHLLHAEPGHPLQQREHLVGLLAVLA